MMPNFQSLVETKVGSGLTYVHTHLVAKIYTYTCMQENYESIE